jgi:hypothetical protein
MGNKIKVRELATMRNGLSMRQLGDKNYKAVEYVPDFYKKSHVVPPVFGRVNKEEIIK